MASKLYFNCYLEQAVLSPRTQELFSQEILWSFHPKINGNIQKKIGKDSFLDDFEGVFEKKYAASFGLNVT